MKLKGDKGAVSVVQANAALALIVDDVGCVTDIDTVADLRAAERLLRRSLSP